MVSGPTSRAVGHSIEEEEEEEEEEEDDEIAGLPISIADSDRPFGSSDAGILYGLKATPETQ